MEVQLLAELLRPPAQEEEDDDTLDAAGPSPYGNPGAIPSQSPHGGDAGLVNKDIWKDEEVGEGGEHDFDDPRQEPYYEMVYKQAVSTEDVFLGMGNKSPTTASCEDIIVRIHLQGVQYKNVDLVVTSTFLDCSSPQYRLGLHLPHKVDPDKGSAEWLSKDQVLEVTLRLDRPLDDLNH